MWMGVIQPTKDLTSKKLECPGEEILPVDFSVSSLLPGYTFQVWQPPQSHESIPSNTEPLVLFPWRTLTKTVADSLVCHTALSPQNLSPLLVGKLPSAKEQAPSGSQSTQLLSCRPTEPHQQVRRQAQTSPAALKTQDKIWKEGM